MNERKPVGQLIPMETAETRNRKSDSKPAKLSREVQARLGQQLRSMYDDVVNQGLQGRRHVGIARSLAARERPGIPAEIG